MSTIDTISANGVRRSRLGIGSGLLLLVRIIERALEKRRSRHALMELSDAQLKDIGISRSQAFEEASRPFWE